MASLLNSHLEQISLCATSIAELPFPGPKMFTNALLSQHDITSLIRDTEQHERALFHLAPPPLPGVPGTNDSTNASNPPAASTAKTPKRRATVYGQRPPKSRAVAAVLGGDLYNKTRQESAAARIKGEMDVEVLLEGAERLLAVYNIPGTTDRIAQLRSRHRQLTANIKHYEARVNQQSEDLARMNKAPVSDDEELIPYDDDDNTITSAPVSKEDLEKEEAEIRELERKKQALSERVNGMEKDLGGLMR
ncbi:putative DASH complex subunit Spc34 protein [Septoria linicola]|nr:putative DASH complex subunit Spc34 protein [Septoria linicola]